MNYIKINPVGVDQTIQKIQERLYNKLGFSNIDGYGRIYEIEKDGNTLPAYFLTGTDYREVLYNDKNNSNGNFFFYEDPVSKKVTSTQLETTLNIIFQLDVNKLQPDSTQRNDEEIRAKIEKELRRTAFEVDTITRGLEALKGFDHNLRDRKLLFLRFSGKVRYQINC